MRVFLAVWAIVLGLATVVSAEPFDSSQVSGGATWLVHFDADAIGVGEVPRTIGRLLEELPTTRDGLRRLTAATGIVLRENLHSVTIYGRGFAESDGVVILRADVQRRRLIVLLESSPNYRTEVYGDHELHVWTANEGKQDEHQLTGCFYDPTVVVFGRNAAVVKKALDVLDGKSPALSPSDRLLTPPTPDGAMVLARAIDLADAEQLKSPLVQKAKSLFLVVGEREGEAFAVAGVVTESAEVARRVRAVANGLLALVQLQVEAEPEVLEILDGVKVSSEGRTVTMECQGDADLVARMVEKAWQRTQDQRQDQDQAD